MKLIIKDVEKKLGKKLKKNFKCVGFDTAEKTGVCFISTTNTEIIFDWTFLAFDTKNEYNMFAQMYKEFGELLTNEDMAIIEEVFVGFSRKGSLKLAKMGTLVMAQCFNKKIKWQLIPAVTARKIMKIDARKFGKGKSKQSVKWWLENVLGLEMENEDVADAIVLALCGVVNE